MHLTDLFSADDLQAQLDALMVKATPHPSGRLTILNYTKRAQYTPELWNHVTDKCRGLIVDHDGNVVARPFEKFWNLDDARHPETMTGNLPATAPLVTQKFDGSLGIGYQLDGEWFVATRGAFTSDQALWASAWLAGHAANHWPPGFTPLFEIVYPENQIVVKYDFAGLVLLAMVEITTGEEVVYPDLLAHGARNAMPVAAAISEPLSALVARDIPNEEGYVAAWARPGATPLRVKIKYENYVRLHRLLTGTNAVTVWEMLRDGMEIAQLTTGVPSDFRAWIDAMERRFHDAFAAIETRARESIAAYGGGAEMSSPEQKKQFALYVMGQHQPISGVLFAMSTGKNYAPLIWKMIRPRGDEEKTFKVEEE